ncbi:MAG: hypothetical protein AB2A00_12075 [Myxococcota bacterium]
MRPPLPGLGPLQGRRCDVTVQGSADPLVLSTVKATLHHAARSLGCAPAAQEGDNLVVKVRVTQQDRGPAEARGARAFWVEMEAQAPWLAAPLKDGLTVACRSAGLGHPACHSVLMFRLEPFSHAVWDAALLQDGGYPAGPF